MQHKTTYGLIFNISFPIMLGSAVQNVIALTDSVFLYHFSNLDFRAIGLVSVFYLIISAIGFGFSRGGQIIIARRYGEKDNRMVVRSFWSLLYLELILALLIFSLIHLFGSEFFQWIVSDEATFEKCMDYLYPRSYGIFFSYLGVIFIALYSGIAKTTFILVDALILAVINIFLNYLLIFGNYGFQELGIEGAGWASSIAEFIAFLVFIIYVILEKNKRVRGLFKIPPLQWSLIYRILNVSIPIVMQAIVGLGAWFIFFSMIEKMGNRALEISNLVRIVYLILSIPTWGFSSGINTLVSTAIGDNRKSEVIPIVWKTVKFNLLLTLLITLPIVIFPETMLFPLFGQSDMSLIIDAKPLFYLLICIMLFFAIGGIVFNGILGIGATQFGFRLQFSLTIFYLLYVYLIIQFFPNQLLLVWCSEILYWVLTLIISIWFLYRSQWQKIQI